MTCFSTYWFLLHMCVSLWGRQNEGQQGDCLHSLLLRGWGRNYWWAMGHSPGPQGPCSLWKWKPLSCVQFFVTPWTIQFMEFSSQNTGVGSLSLLQGIFPTQRLNPGLPHCRQILYQLTHQGSPRILEWVAYPFSRRSSRPRNQTRVSWRRILYHLSSGKPDMFSLKDI